MLPRLEAGEQLAAVRSGALAAGNLERSAHRRAIHELVERANGQRQRARKAKPEDLAAAGIGMRIVEPGDG